MNTRTLFLTLGIAMVSAITSCNSDSDGTEPAKSTTITQSALPYTDGHSAEIGIFDLSGIPSLAGGENLVWDLSNVTVASSGQTNEYSAYADSRVPDANLSFDGVSINSLSGEIRDIFYLRGLDQTGYYSIGVHYLQGLEVSIFGGAGSITFPDDDMDAYSEKKILLKFPVNYGDTHTQQITSTDEMIANLPSQGINNVPGDITDTEDFDSEVIGWGQLKLPDYDQPFDALLIKYNETTTRNYFLGGAPAPADLLTALGLVDGAVDPNIESWAFYSPDHGLLAYFQKTAGGEFESAYYIKNL